MNFKKEYLETVVNAEQIPAGARAQLLGAIFSALPDMPSGYENLPAISEKQHSKSITEGHSVRKSGVRFAPSDRW